MSAKILSLGAMYFEINTPNFPLPDALPIETETVGGRYSLNPGGSAINFARVCASLGLPPIFVGKLGNDLVGDELSKMLVKEGITPAFIKSSSVQTNFALNFVRNDGKTLMFVNGTANQSLIPQEVEEQLLSHLSDVNYLYIGGALKLSKLLSIFPEIIAKAKEKGVKVALDHGRKTNATAGTDIDLVKEVVGMVDYYFPSKDELLAVWDTQDIDEAIKKVREVSKAIIAIKDSANGAYGVVDETIHVPAFTVQVKNTVGAGDSFNAGFIKAQVDGMNLKDSLRFANATAALKISTEELPTEEKVLNFLNQHA